MFSAKRIGLTLIAGLSGLLSMGFLSSLFFMVVDIVKDPKGAGIFLLAWPVTLIFLLPSIVFVSIAVISIKKIDEIDKEVISSGTEIKNKIPQVKMTPIIKFGLLFFGIVTIFVLLANFLK